MPQNDSTHRTPVIFELDRAFDAPRERVWQAWSDVTQLAQWWGPAGCTIAAHRFEFRAGGFFHYEMQFPGMPSMWGRFNYREIGDTDRIVWLNSFANEYGGIARAPFSVECPMEIENTVSLVDEGGKTRIALRAQPFGATAEELRFFDNLKPSLEQGFGGTFERLADFLK